jgi:hypothetical protein
MYKVIILAVMVFNLGYDFLMRVLAVRQKKKPLPENVRDIYDEKEYARWREYSAEKSRAGLISTVADFVLGVFLFGTNVFSAVYGVLPGGDILSAGICLDVAAVDKVLTYAGVTRTAPMECAVYEDNRLIGFFPREDVCFTPNIPEGAVWRDVLTGEVLQRGTALEIEARGARAFYIE